MTRFDLEQEILNCWGVTDEINMLADVGASREDIKCLATLYEYKFKKLWAVFEDMVHEGKFKKG
jgi:hypothetical protein